MTSPKRPWYLTFFAVFQILFGGFGLASLILSGILNTWIQGELKDLGPNAPDLGNTSELMRVGLLTSGVWGGLTLAAGIGVMRRSRWALRLSLALALVGPVCWIFSQFMPATPLPDMSDIPGSSIFGGLMAVGALLFSFFDLLALLAPATRDYFGIESGSWMGPDLKVGALLCLPLALAQSYATKVTQAEAVRVYESAKADLDRLNRNPITPSPVVSPSPLPSPFSSPSPQ